MPFHSPILVTGSPRSGTTWVGRMIAASSAVGFIWEPFNLLHRPGVCGADFPNWFMYVSEKNEAPYYEHLNNTLSFSYGFHRELRALRSIRDVRRMATQYWRFAQYRRFKRRSLMKDPCAVFSAEWLARRFDMQVVVMIRHPAAYAASIQTLKWPFQFSDVAGQPLLMEAYLHPFAAEIQDFARHPHPILDQALLAWKLFYHTVYMYKLRNPKWLFLRQEDLAKAPLEGFERLYAQLGLDYTEQVRQVILNHSREENSQAFPGAQTIRRNSRATSVLWKSRFSQKEIQSMKKRVEDVSQYFYTDDEW